MSMKYEILENNTVEVFYDDNDFPSLRQPNYPNGEPFTDKAAAESWAVLYIASVEDPAAPFAPSGPNEVGAPKPTAEELIALQNEINDSIANAPSDPLA